VLVIVTFCAALAPVPLVLPLGDVGKDKLRYARRERLGRDVQGEQSAAFHRLHDDDSMSMLRPLVQPAAARTANKSRRLRKRLPGLHTSTPLGHGMRCQNGDYATVRPQQS
jgi:hypothetical protein